MKKITFLLLILLSNTLTAQNHEKLWVDVIENENLGRIKTANRKVEIIYKAAKASNNEVEIIKCFFYKSKYLQILDENAQLKIILNLENEIKTASIPSKSILNYVYAKCLKDYIKNNGNKLYKRTKLENGADGNFLTWDSYTFNTKIDDLFDLSIKNENNLKSISLDKYESIFDFIDNTDSKKQSLFDYLVKECIEHYKSKDNYIYLNNKDKYQDLLGTDSDFLKANIDSLNKVNLVKTLNLFKKISNNVDDNFTLNRIEFCNNTIIQNSALFQKKISVIQRQTKDSLVYQKIQLKKALYFAENRNGTLGNQNYIIAIKVLDSILKSKYNYDIKKIALQERNKITQPNISAEFQKYSYENENTRIHIAHKNIDSIKLTFYKIDNELFSKENSNALHIAVKNIKPFLTQKYVLKNNKDYHYASTEFLLPKLEIGSYIIEIVPLDKQFEDEKKYLNTINITNHKIISWNYDATDFYKVVHRKTGRPVENCKIKSYDFELITDKNGEAKRIVQNKKNNYYSKEAIILIKDKDSSSIAKEMVYYNDTNNNEKKPKISGKIYLDRAIYRPGQKVFFKAILIKTIKDQHEVKANFPLKIILEDENSFELELDGITNEFGSFSGEFQLPKVLTGNFTISIDEPESQEYEFDYKNEYFNVEEYKRPTFDVVIENPKELFKINSNAFFKGYAKSFSDAAISNATINYFIVRSENNGYRSSYNYNSETILSGTSKTDNNGNFIIPFETKVTNGDQKIYHYFIRVTITDSNGETRFSEKTIKIGNQTLLLGVSIPQKIYTKDTNTLSINSFNLNDEFSPVEGKIEIYYLKPYEHKFKNNAPLNNSYNSISKKEFEEKFPYEIYHESNTAVSDSLLVYTKKVSTLQQKNIVLDFIKNYKSGYYSIVFSAKDKENNNIVNSKNFEIIQSNDKLPIGNNFFMLEQINEDPKNDGFVLINLKCAVNDAYVTREGMFNGNLFYSLSDVLNSNETILKIPINNSITSNFLFRVESFYENQYFTNMLNIKLKIPEIENPIFETITYRNKLEPGMPETWSFKIKNSKSDFEVLASMYDSSLDTFALNMWKDLKPESEINNYFFTKHHLFENKGTVNFTTKIEDKNYSFYTDKTDLIWFGFDFNNSKTLEKDLKYKKQINKKIIKTKKHKLVYGFVVDSTGPLPGANIYIKGSTRSVSTDIDGYFEIDALINEKIVFSFQGYTDQVIVVTKNTERIEIKLIESSKILEEVLITGAMGIKRTKDLTTSSQQIVKASEISQSSSQTVAEGLVGKVSGLQIVTTNYGKNSSPRIVINGGRSITKNNEALIIIDGEVSSFDDLNKLSKDQIIEIEVLKENESEKIYGNEGKNGAIVITTKNAIKELSKVKLRKNFNETAFFFPNIKTDKNGNFKFSFQSPEALTKWRLQLLAHDKNVNQTYDEKTVITQKELMIYPNMPRFFREKDTIIVSTKINNLTTSKKTGIATLQLFDAVTQENIDSKTILSNSIQNYHINPSGSTIVKWRLVIPDNCNGIDYKIIAKSGDFSDGEENSLPVLKNTILVTESIPVWVRENSIKEYSFDNLKSNTSNSLQNHQFVLEYTSNPTWIAIQSLPYLMEYEHECAEQTFARYYANTLATEIINNNPTIKNIFEDWKKTGKPISKLELNEDLKSLTLAETPWIKDAENEDEKKNKLALLFNLEKMKNTQDATFEKLKNKQNSSGGFVWFDGGTENEYITRHILAGLGHLKKLKATTASDEKISEVIKKGISYIDNKFLECHKQLAAYQKKYSKFNSVNPYSNLHYLYTRSFYLEDYPISDSLKAATKKYLDDTKENWLNYSLYEKGLAALTLNRFGEKATAKMILESLKETSSNNEDWGMYWIENKSGWYWYQAPIETQALLIEAFSEIDNDRKSVDAMKVWLLKNKQAKNWPTTKSTTEAIYALLLQGKDWISVKDNTIFNIGDKKIMKQKLSENEKEAETGYIKMAWKSNEITKEMGAFSIQNNTDVPGYGGVYWQYFEDLDKIKTNIGSLLSTTKELFIKKNTSKGEELQRITTENSLKLGDLVTVRLIITTKEDLEYVHLKDMRASCFEPVNVLSEYKWNDGLGYYISTKDAATHFFFDKINKGTYVIEYDIRVNNVGDFSNGITTIQSMYAPEYTSHTKGIRVIVKE